MNLYVDKLGSEGFAVMREATVQERKDMLARGISPVFARCESYNDAKRIALCVNKCENLTNGVLEVNIIEGAIDMLVTRYPREITYRGPDPHYEGVKIWEVEG